MRFVAVLVALLIIQTAHALGTIEGFVVDPYLAANSPTGIRFTGPNEGFFIEKGGTVKRFAAGSVSTALNLTLASGAERGLLGIELDPQFASNKYVYLYYTAGSGGAWTGNQLNRFTWNGSNLIEAPFATPRMFGTEADGQSQGPNHNGGPLVFGRSGVNNGKLFGVTGDLNRTGIEQNNKRAATSAFTGGVYRLNSDGTIPTDNKFATHTDPGVRPWYSYGVRNSFGLAFDPATGNLWNTENGLNDFDEINLVLNGMNSGWNAIMGPDSEDPQNASGDLVELDGSAYLDPKFSFETPIGITALQFLHGAWGGGSLDNALIFGDNNTGNLWLLRLNAARDGFELSGVLANAVLDSGETMTPFGSGFQIITDLQINPYDNHLYIVELGEGISRVAPIPEPHTWVLSLAGLTLVGWAVHRRTTQRN
jgi:aldose sugar dehydrogenase